MLALGVVLVLFVLGLQWLLRPANLTQLVLEQAGQALGLDITASGLGEYRLRGNPQLVVRGVDVRQRGAATPVLQADRILLSVPWSTLQSRGRDLRITHVELDRPVLDLQALAQWQASRPPSAEARIPTLTDGLEINDGQIRQRNWSIVAIHAAMPVLAADRPVRARIRARFEDDASQVPFDLALAMTAPADGAGIAAIGPLAVVREGWQLDGNLDLRARLAMSGDGMALNPATLGYAGQWRGDGPPLPLQLGMHGPFAFKDGIWRYGWQHLRLRGGDTVPAIDARGAFALGPRLVLRLQGAIREWPEGWPALPAPLHASRSPLPFKLDYAGSSTLADITTLHLQRDATTFDGRLRLPEVLDWIGNASASPLPPLEGRLHSPWLEIGGLQMEGVQIEISEDAP